MKRYSRVVLEANNTTQEFSIEHATRILRMPKNGGWKLPKDSKFKFDLKDGITNNGDSRKDKSTK